MCSLLSLLSTAAWTAAMSSSALEEQPARPGYNLLHDAAIRGDLLQGGRECSQQSMQNNVQMAIKCTKAPAEALDRVAGLQVGAVCQGHTIKLTAAICSQVGHKLSLCTR